MPLANQCLVINDIPVEVRPNSRRRTRMGMTFDPGGFLVLDVPVNASLDDVQDVINEHARWLRHRLGEIKDTASQSTSLCYSDGELVHYQGAALLLRVCTGLFSSVTRIKGELVVTSPDPDPLVVRRLLTQWYTDQAQVIFAQVLAQYQHLPWLNGQIPVWKQRYMRSQWGSCSVSGRLSLNTHLIKTPKSLLEYVILHELCHIKHHNHGKQFHALVTKYMPDWQQRSRELEKYLPLLLQV